MAPELLRGEPYTTKSDIFSIGSFLFNLITNKTLFKGTSIREVLYRNANEDPVKIVDKNIHKVSSELKDLLK